MGNKTWEAYSMEGELLTFVPPSMVTRSGIEVFWPSILEQLDKRRNGSIACKTKRIEPGEDIGM